LFGIHEIQDLHTKQNVLSYAKATLRGLASKISNLQKNGCL